MYARYGRPFDIDEPQFIDDIQYPIGWFYDAANRAALGVIEVDETPPSHGQYQSAVRGELTFIDGAWQLPWAVVDWTPEQIAAAVAATVPASCTRRQGRLALLQKAMLDAVEATIAAITDPVRRRAAQIEYEADTWERGNVFLQQMWTSLGGDTAGLDDLFRLAITL